MASELVPVSPPEPPPSEPQEGDDEGALQWRSRSGGQAGQQPRGAELLASRLAMLRQRATRSRDPGQRADEPRAQRGDLPALPRDDGAGAAAASRLRAERRGGAPAPRGLRDGHRSNGTATTTIEDATTANAAVPRGRRAAISRRARGLLGIWPLHRRHRAADAGSVLINRYRRAARRVSELGLGELTPLDEAIPELLGPFNLTVKGPLSRGSMTLRGSPIQPLGIVSSRGRTRTGTPSRKADFESLQIADHRSQTAGKQGFRGSRCDGSRGRDHIRARWGPFSGCVTCQLDSRSVALRR